MLNETVPRIYEGKTAVLFATGPSLTKEVVDQVWPYVRRGEVFAMGCNDAYRIVPYLDVHYACDPAWWDRHVEAGWIMDYVCEQKWTQCTDSAPKYKLHHINGDSNHGLSKKQDFIHFGGNSGYQLLNLAFLFGATRVILCGYNMSIPPGHLPHFFGDHPPGLNRGQSYNGFAEGFKSIQGDFKKVIINSTPNSALKGIFQWQELSDALQGKPLSSSGLDPALPKVN